MSTDITTIVSSQAIMKPYLGQVATGGRIPTVVTTSNTYFMGRRPFVARDNISNPRLVFANWYVNSGVSPYAEANGAGGGNITLTASIEYPAGTFIQATFSQGASGAGAPPTGNPQGVIPTGSEITSDPVPTTIPVGARFWVRTYQNAPGGITYDNELDQLNGGASNFGTSATAVSDQTMSGTITQVSGNTTATIGPVAIIAPTSKPSVLLVGDSRTQGVNDAFDASGDVGETARSIGPSLAYINAGVAGDTVAGFIASGKLRTSLARYCTHVLVDFGVNDIYGGATYSTLRGSLQTLWGFWQGRKSVWGTTITPHTTSSDSFATLANQTVTEPTDYARVFINDMIRNGTFGLDGYFEVADQVESSRNSGKWKVNGSAYAYTLDGVHCSPAGYLLIQSSGAINPTLLVR